jgi:hypothetical protein
MAKGDHSLDSVQLPDKPRQVSGEILGGVATFGGAGAPVAAKINSYHPVGRREVWKLPAPVVRIARVAVDEQQRRVAISLISEKQPGAADICKGHGGSR